MNFTVMTNAIIPVSKYTSLVVVLVCLFDGHINAQTYKMRENWYFGSQLSIVSFFGDLSVHDFDPVRKLTEESDLAWGFLAGKSINRLIDTRIYYNHGHMRGSNAGLDMYFSNDFNEFCLGTTLNLSRLIKPASNSRLTIAASAGLGLNFYRSIKYSITDGSYLSSEGFSQEKNPVGEASSALVVPLGLELNYHPGKNWMYLLGFSFRMHNQDLLDSHIGSTGISDRYSLLSIGCSYIVNPKKKKPKQKIPGVPESF
ncbi:MAG: hypothetical protein IPH20_01945 [Bacteroidales bacterium]|nr:hypothetical protein [Bacteroidales bacterium]